MKTKKKHLLLAGSLLIQLHAISQNLLPNGNFENSGGYEIHAQETNVPYGFYNFYYPVMPAPSHFLGPYAPGQFTGGQFSFYNISGQAIFSGTSGIRFWNNPYKWIPINMEDDDCVRYGYTQKFTTGPSGPGNYWTFNRDTTGYSTFTDRILDIKFHAADWYKGGDMGGKYFYVIGSPFGTDMPPGGPHGDVYYKLDKHRARSGVSYIGMKPNSLIQTYLSPSPFGNNELQGDATYKFTCAIKPVKDASINAFAFRENGDGLYGNYFLWASQAKLVLILAKNKMVYEHADCYSPCDNPAFKEKECGLSGQQLLEYTVCDLIPSQIDFNDTNWITITRFIKAPSNAKDLEWLGIELHGNCDNYIIMDDVSLEKIDPKAYCEKDITISYETLTEWAGNDRSSSSYIRLGPGVVVPSGANSKMIAEHYIELLSGFSSESGAAFLASISSCDGFINSHLTSGIPDLCDNLNGRINQHQGETQEESENNIQIVPNPAHRVAHVQSLKPVDYIEIMDLNGRVIVKTNNRDIDLRELAPGLYIVRVHLNDGLSETKRLVIITQ